MSKESPQSLNRLGKIKNAALSAITALTLNGCSPAAFQDSDCSRQTIVSGLGQEISRGRSQFVKRVYATTPSNPGQEGSIFIAIEPNSLSPSPDPLLEQITLSGGFEIRIGIFYPNQAGLISTGAIGQDLEHQDPTGLWNYQRNGFDPTKCNIIQAQWRFGKVIRAEWKENTSQE